jgi:hypothetical protein
MNTGRQSGLRAYLRIGGERPEYSQFAWRNATGGSRVRMITFWEPDLRYAGSSVALTSL